MGAWEAPPLPARVAGRAKPVFVGRAAETAAAEQGWAAVRSGARELIFIGGEPGAGKSRLAEEMAAALHRQGAVVLIGTCSPEPGRPYEPFAECLEQLLGGTAEGVLAEYLGGSAGELLRLTPLVRRHRPDLPPRRATTASTAGSSSTRLPTCCGPSARSARWCASWRTCTGLARQPCSC